eukprot:6191497-Pleurochrysis_carterae.AAC.2
MKETWAGEREQLRPSAMPRQQTYHTSGVSISQTCCSAVFVAALRASVVACARRSRFKERQGVSLRQKAAFHPNAAAGPLRNAFSRTMHNGPAQSKQITEGFNHAELHCCTEIRQALQAQNPLRCVRTIWQLACPRGRSSHSPSTSAARPSRTAVATSASISMSISATISALLAALKSPAATPAAGRSAASVHAGSPTRKAATSPAASARRAKSPAPAPAMREERDSTAAHSNGSAAADC